MQRHGQYRKTKQGGDVNVTEKQLKWHGHVKRREESHVVRRMLGATEGCVTGKRQRGGQKTRWKDSCKGDMEMWVKGGGHIGQDTLEQRHTIPHHPAPPRDGKVREEANGEEDIFKTS